MNKVNICSQLDLSTYILEVFDKEENFSSGTGVAINDRGDILTAAHVLTNRLPVRTEDAKDPDLVILGKTKHSQFIKYYPLICGFIMESEYLTESLTVDIAVLRPEKVLSNIPHLKINTNKFPVGTEVLMAGFPDEMELPFVFNRFINMSHPEIINEREKLIKNIKIAQRLLMIKSGMVGHISKFNLIDGTKKISGEFFNVDNGMHSGASGGPIVNQYCQVIGVITKRLVTDASNREIPQLEVPSGTTVAVSTRCLSLFLN